MDLKREHELGQTAEARKRTDRDLRCIGWGLVLLGVLMPALVTVENTGQTIPDEELQLIFDRFHKTDHSRSVDREGVGLGLYIVKTILGNLKENITVTSEDGVTNFTFTLTLA